MSDSFATILQQALAPGYTLERELTGGGMSRVFVASDVALGRKVVIKVLPPELAAGVNHERFRREIQVAAQLQHPHVVPLLSAGEQGALIWYTMPFIHGSSLRETLARGQAYSVKEVVHVLRDVADALDYAHGLGVIHRDIKPGNVLLMGSHALVTDFGVAKAISASMPTSGFTSAGMAIGTPAYMAPEQIAADPAADHRMDLYALGLLGYEMLTGKVPFKEDSPQKTMAAQLTRDPEPVEHARGDVPAPLAALIRQLLAKQPEDRPQRASLVVAALDEIALTSGQHPASARPARKPSVARTLAVGVAGVAMVAAAWMMGEHNATETVTAAVRDSLAQHDSLELVTAAPALLTREDSIAIARAVTERKKGRTVGGVPAAAPPAGTVSAGGGAASAEPARAADRGPITAAEAAALERMADSIRTEVQRLVLDSVMRFARFGPRRDGAPPEPPPGMPSGMPAGLSPEAMSTGTGVGKGAAPDARAVTMVMRPTGPRRVVVAPPRPSRTRPDMDTLAGLIADSLRTRIDAHPRYVIVPADSVAAVLREVRTVNGVQERLESDLIISISLAPAKDSVVRIITARDLSAPPGANVRSIVSTVPAGDPQQGIADLVPKVVQSLLEMERNARFRDPRDPRTRAARPEP
ncbi:MAG: serine/threonine protein kinase [Gemmatimonadaceae bacterium]|nr:serine/threonine protein kinase [Gemmatimonadaceae bacterium]